MKNITFLLVLISCFTVANVYAGTPKKEIKKQNEMLQHQVDSLSAVNKEKDKQIENMKQEKDSLLGVRIALELENRDLQEENTDLQKQNQNMQEQINELQLKLDNKKKKETEQQAYIKNKGYYPSDGKEYCEKIAVCAKWANDMAKKYGKSFEIIDIVKKESYKDKSYTTREIRYGEITPNGNPIVDNVKHTSYEMTSDIIIKYSLNNNIVSKKLECQKYTSSKSDKTCDKYKWIE